MKSAVEKVLEAEREAVHLLDEARKGSQEKIRNARVSGEAYVLAAGEHTRKAAEALLHDAAEATELEARRVKAEAEARAERMVRFAGNLNLAFLSSYIDRISGISS